MKRLLGMLLLVCTVLAIVGAPAQAVLITNGATTIFSDDFESHTVGDPPPSPWTVSTTGTSSIEVINDVSPGANQGSNYVEIYRATGGSSLLTNYFTSQTSGTVRLELGVYTKSVSGSGSTAVQLSTSTGDGGIYMTLNANGQVKVSNGSGYQLISGLSWSADTWHNVAIEYVPNATTATIAIDGVSATPDIFQTSEISRFCTYAGGSEDISYVDAYVPEPATMSLLALGGLGVLIRRRK